MECIRGLYNIRPRHQGAVVSIGNFDGFHRGHRELVRLARIRATALGVPTLLMLFEPQPREYFQGSLAPARLMRLSAKLKALKAAGVDRVLIVPFDADFAGLSAQAFIDDIMNTALRVRGLVIGDDFRFGARRSGDFAMLKDAGARAPFFVESAPTLLEGGARVSSTRLREALAQGDLEGAHSLTGAHYAYEGRVIHGDARGRQLGFPTANIAMPDPAPLAGVFAVEAVAADGRVHRGVANVGRRPTVGGRRVLLEAHLFDFAGDLYGQRLSVRFLKRLRAEQKFASLLALQAQIEQDRQAAHAFFADHRTMT